MYKYHLDVAIMFHNSPQMYGFEYVEIPYVFRQVCKILPMATSLSVSVYIYVYECYFYYHR